MVSYDDIPPEMKDDWLSFQRIPGPVWNNECEHSGYIGTVESLDSVNGIPVQEKLDVYVFESSYPKQSVCLRFGNEPSEYYAPLGVIGLIEGKHLFSGYKNALELLLKEGKIEWSKK